MRFANKTAVVTGAASGIGLATARLLAAEGARVWVADVQPPPPGAPFEFIQADVGDQQQVDSVFWRVEAEAGCLHLLATGAGRPYRLNSLSSSEGDWEECLRVNLKSVWLCARAAHRLLTKSPGSSIVTIASAQALRSTRASFPYSVAKGGLLSLTRSLAVEYAPQIRVNAVIPGQVESVRTEAYFRSFRDPEEARRRVLSSFPLGRLGKPEDVAKAILFLASDDAAWITGSFLTVDGGRDAAMLNLSDLEPAG